MNVKRRRADRHALVVLMHQGISCKEAIATVLTINLKVSIVRKAVHATFLFHEGIRLFELKHYEEVLDVYKQVRVVLVYDIVYGVWVYGDMCTAQ